MAWGEVQRYFARALGFTRQEKSRDVLMSLMNRGFFDSNFDLDSIMKQRDEKPTVEKMGPAGSASERNKEIAKE